MALINPSTLYSGGNVKLDFTPYLRIAMQERAKKQAVQDALFKHYSELPNSINTAGARWQDLNDLTGHGQGSINEQIFDAQDYFNKIKGEPLRSPVWQNLESKWQQIHQSVNASKAEGQFQLATGKAFFDGKHAPRPADIKISDAVNLSIFDKNHFKNPDTKQPYSYNDYSVSAPAYTSQIEAAHNKNITNGIVPDRDPNDKGVFDAVAQKVTYNYGYNLKKLKQIGDNSSNEAAYNRTLHNKYEDMLGNPADAQTATEAGQLVYGKDFIANTPEKMAAGTKIAEYSQIKIPKIFNDRASLQAWKDKDREDRQAQQRSENAKKEAGKDRRVSALAKLGVNIEDPMEYLDKAPVIEVPQINFDATSPFGSVKGKPLHFVPFPSDMSEDNIRYIAGKRSESTGERDLPTSNVNGKEGFYRDDIGIYYDKNMKPIDRNRGLINSIKDKETSLGKQKKGKVKVEGSKSEVPPTTRKHIENRFN